MDRLWHIALAFLIGHTACGGSTDSPSAPTPVTNRPVSALTLNVSDLALQVGETGNLSATASYSDGTSAQLSNVEWGSSNTTVASVNSQGTVIAHAVGAATITASSSGHSRSVSVTVTPAVAVDRLAVTAQKKTLRVGETTTVTLTASYSDGSQAQVAPTWSSRNAAVATVTAAGTVTAVAEGQAVIWGTYDGKNPSVTITVIPAATVDLLAVTAQKKTLRVGETTTVTLTASYSDGSQAQVAPTWSSRNTAVATVTAAGTVTAVAEGQAVIWGTYQGKNPSVKITVIDLTSIDINISNTNLTVGQSATATVTARYSNGSTSQVSASWSSSNTAVATVSSGTVTAVATGSATITATHEGKTGTVAVTVTAADDTSDDSSSDDSSSDDSSSDDSSSDDSSSDDSSSDDSSSDDSSSDDSSSDDSSSDDSSSGRTVTSVSVSAPSTTLTVGATTTVTATANYSDGTSETITPSWWSLNEGVATVSASGIVTCTGLGTASIRTEYGGQDGSILITGVAVSESATVTNLSVSAAATSLTVDETTTVSATATYSDGTTATVTPSWSSSNTAVATVSSSGTVTAVAAGTAQITGTYEGQSGTSPTITVTAPTPTVTATTSWTGDFDGNFGNVIVGESGRYGLRIHNPSSSDIVVDSYSSDNGSVFETSCDSSNICSDPPRVVTAGSQGGIYVKFLPQAAGSVTGTVTYIYCSVEASDGNGSCGANGQTVSANVSGTGVAQTRIISVLPVSVQGNETGYLDFGEVTIGDQKDMPFKIRNSGNYQLTYSGLTAALQAIIPPTSAHSQYGYSLVPSANTGTVAPGETVTLTVRFYAQVEATYSDTLTVPSDATSVDGVNSIPISATGVLP